MPQVTLGSLLAGLPAEQAAARKAEALAIVLPGGRYEVGNQYVAVATPLTTFVVEGVTITLLRAHYLPVRDWLGLEVSAEDASGPLPLPAPPGLLYYYNPPIEVRVSETETREDLVAAAQAYIAETVFAWARAHGWGG